MALNEALPVFPYREEAELAPSWAGGVAGDGKDEKTAHTEAIGRTIDGGQEAKMETLLQSLAGQIG